MRQGYQAWEIIHGVKGSNQPLQKIEKSGQERTQESEASKMSAYARL